jgi:hypothetical protein
MLEERTMRSWYRNGALMLALLAGATLVSAMAEDDATGSIGTVGVGHGASLPLSDEQRGWIFLAVINLPDVPEAAISAVEVSAALPDSVELQALPEIVTRRIPLVGNYKFVKLEDRILLVDPDNREVAAQIARYKLLN